MILIWIFTFVPGQAQANIAGIANPSQNPKELIASTSTSISTSTVVPSPSSPTAAPTQPVGARSSAAVCTSRVRELSQKKTLVIVYVFGYKDTRPARFVGDRYEKLQLVQRLTRSCDDEQYLCEFERSAKDAYIFEKQITRGPETQKIILQLVSSSASEDDDENRRQPWQEWQSLRARQSLLRGLQQADIVFYNGHSRSGGGPDFAPPVLNRTQEVDYSYYRLEKTQFKILLDALRKSKAHPTLVGLFSCRAEDLFGSQLEAVNQRVTLLAAPHLISYQEALHDSVYALEAILGNQCEKLDRLYRVARREKSREE